MRQTRQQKLFENLLKSLFLFPLILWLCPANLISAQEGRIVVINEIAWMGTENQWQDEWLELYNPTDSPIKIDRWILKSKDEKPKIILTGTIEARSYFLLERTDDTTILRIPAQQIYKGGLDNQGEHLILLDDLGKTIDDVDCFLGWFTGSNETKKTMERLNPLVDGSNPLNWQTSKKSGGSPRAENVPHEIRQKTRIGTIPTGSSYSGYSFVLAIGSTISLFLSMLVLVFLLKTKQKKDKMK